MAADPIEFDIRPFEESDRNDVRDLWRHTEMFVESNDPDADIDRKLAHSPKWFFVGMRGKSLVATAMVGYDGHRGRINYLAVHRSEQGTGVGAAMMLHAEQVLAEAGCDKVNVQVLTANAEAIGFCEAMGYTPDPVVSMGHHLESIDAEYERETAGSAPV